MKMRIAYVQMLLMSIGDIHKTSKIVTIPTRILLLFPTNQHLVSSVIEHISTNSDKTAVVNYFCRNHNDKKKLFLYIKKKKKPFEMFRLDIFKIDCIKMILIYCPNALTNSVYLDL